MTTLATETGSNVAKVLPNKGKLMVTGGFMENQGTSNPTVVNPLFSHQREVRDLTKKEKSSRVDEYV